MSRIKGLDSVRGIAFILVFLVHTRYLNFGWESIQVFFVLSGFLITGILVDMKRTLPTKEFFVKFYGRRFLRIFPLYYSYLFLILALGLILANFGFLVKKTELLLSIYPYALTYVYNFYSITTQELLPVTNHLWSLSVEEQFYIVWPLLIFLVPEKHYKYLFGSAILFGPVFRVVYTLAFNAGYLPFVTEGLSRSAFVLPFTHMDAFGLGALISQYKIPNSSRKLALLSLLVPAIGYGYNFIVVGNVGDIGSLGYPYLMENGYQFLWGYSVVNYWSAVLIDAIAKEGLFLRFLNWRPFVYLGKISYGMYVYHLGIIWIIYRVLDKTVAEPNAWIIALASIIDFGLAFIFASISYRYLEMPILNLKNKYFRLPGEEAPPMAVPRST